MFSIFSIILFVFIDFYEISYWNKIVPLKTRKTEVEKKLGKGKWKDDSTVTYKYNGDTYYIAFSDGKCSESSKSEWNVDKDIVLYFVMYPRNGISVRKMPIDLKSFDKVKMTGDLLNYNKYINEEIGLLVETQPNLNKIEVVTGIQKMPKKTEQYLKCENGK